MQRALQEKKLFDGLTVGILGPLDKVMTEEFELLLRVGGANVVASDVAIGDPSAIIVASCTKYTPKKAATARDRAAAVIVDQAWVMDSVSEHTLLPTARFELANMTAQLASLVRARMG